MLSITFEICQTNGFLGVDFLTKISQLHIWLEGWRRKLRKKYKSKNLTIPSKFIILERFDQRERKSFSKKYLIFRNVFPSN